MMPPEPPPESIVVSGIPFRQDDIDVADLLLELGGRKHVVARKQLVTAWKRLAHDIKARPAAARYADSGKGALASKILVNALARLEKIGAVARVGIAPEHSIVLLKPDLLGQVVDTWDTTPADPE